MKSLTLELNGSKVTREVEPRETLADFLRERCRLTATLWGVNTEPVVPAPSPWTDKRPARAFVSRSCVMVSPYRRLKGWRTIPQWKCCAGISINRTPCSADFAHPAC